MRLDPISLHQDAFVWDNHGCLPMDPARNAEFLPQLARYRTAGVDVVSMNIGYGEISRADHFDMARRMRDWIESQDDLVMVGTLDEIRQGREAGKLGIVFDIEGAAAIETLDDLDAFHALGVRWIALAYNRNNPYAGGCHGEDHGLTHRGRALVARMEALGIAVCCSHVGYRTVEDVLSVATRPVILSHSNPRAVHDHPRNVPDDLLKGVAATGGVIGVNGLKLFLGQDYTAQRLVEHLLYLVDLVGPDHVGLGLDYVFDLDEMDAEKGTMEATFPEGWGYEDPVWCFDIDNLPDLTTELVKKGLSEASIRKILGQNWWRVAGDIWS